MALDAAQRALLNRILYLTKGEAVAANELRESLKMTSEVFETLMKKLEGGGVVKVTEGIIKLESEQRLEIAKLAIAAGADFEAVSRSLDWLEFEELSAKVFENNGFHVLRRFRFTATERRWELDLLAMRTPYLICGECKHWKQGLGNRTARRIVETHLEKVEVFSHQIETLRERIKMLKWVKATIVPMVLTLSATPLEFYRRVPAVSVLSLPAFLDEFDCQLNRLAHFKITMSPIESKRARI
jgi:hypothetical protein